MSYYLYDIHGYLADGPSIVGLEQLAEWANGKPAIEAFIEAGHTEDLEALSEALKYAHATGSVEETREGLLNAALHAEKILILSDGVEEDDEPRAAGGPGSGNFGHAGRPGQVGGSAPQREFGSVEEANEWGRESQKGSIP